MGTWVTDWVIFAGQTTIHSKMEGETKIRTVPLSTSMNILFSEKKTLSTNREAIPRAPHPLTKRAICL